MGGPLTQTMEPHDSVVVEYTSPNKGPVKVKSSVGHQSSAVFVQARGEPMLDQRQKPGNVKVMHGMKNSYGRTGDELISANERAARAYQHTTCEPISLSNPTTTSQSSAHSHSTRANTKFAPCTHTHLPDVPNIGTKLCRWFRCSISPKKDPRTETSQHNREPH